MKAAGFRSRNQPGQQHGAEQHHAAACILKRIRRAHCRNTQAVQEGIAEPAGAGQAQHAQQPLRSAAAAQPERQMEQPQCQRAEAGSPVNGKPERNHAQDGARRAHGRRIIEASVIVRVIGALDQDFRAIFQREGVNAVGGRRFIGLYTALLPCQYAVEKDAPGAEQLRHIERERGI